MARALVTGATGFIGRHLVRALLEAGHEVHALVRPGAAGEELAAMGVRLRRGDLRDPASLAAAVQGIDVVQHLASLLKVPWRPEFRTVNVGGTAALAKAVRACSTPPVLVVTSSLAAAGPSAAGAPSTGDEPPRPVSIYGRVKRDAERAAAEHAAAIPVTVVRPPMVFGEGDRYGLQLFRTVGRGVHLVPTRRTLHVSLVHARDLARALVLAGERGRRLPAEPQPDGPSGQGVYHVAGEERPSYAALGGLVARGLGVPAPRVVRLPEALSFAAAAVSELAGRLRDAPTFLNLDKWREATAGDWTCAIGRARQELGFAPHPLEARLAETAAWYQSERWLGAQEATP